MRLFRRSAARSGLVFFILITFALALAAVAAPPAKQKKSAVSVGGDAMIITDGSGKALFAQNADLRR
ncbi:MAG: hypothetical protein ACKOFH_13625 [Chthoniobacterales bacterium]